MAIRRSTPMSTVMSCARLSCLSRARLLVQDRPHLLDCLPRIWMSDGVFVSSEFETTARTRRVHRVVVPLAAERNQIDEFFTQSSYTQKPVVTCASLGGKRSELASFFVFRLATKISP